MSDFTYSDNVAHAHICAAEALDSHMESVAGKVTMMHAYLPNSLLKQPLCMMKFFYADYL